MAVAPPQNLVVSGTYGFAWLEPVDECNQGEDAYPLRRPYSCKIGRGGLTFDKREGDGATPVGKFPLTRVFYRPDRLPPPATGLPLQAIRPQDGWCDDPEDPKNYNTLITRPYEGSHEILWREDHVYDLIIEIGYNNAPPVPYKGSALFIHNAPQDDKQTAGCVAFQVDDLKEILGSLASSSMIIILPP